jgi:hypothetical protein
MLKILRLVFQSLANTGNKLLKVLFLSRISLVRDFFCIYFCKYFYL